MGSLIDIEEKIRDKAWSEFKKEMWTWLEKKKDVLGWDICQAMNARIVNSKELKLKIQNQAVIDFISAVEDARDRIDDIEFQINN